VDLHPEDRDGELRVVPEVGDVRLIARGAGRGWTVAHAADLPDALAIADGHGRRGDRSSLPDRPAEHKIGGLLAIQAATGVSARPC
jgi:hypothetical protein